jgi:hypothetical protein
MGKKVIKNNTYLLRHINRFVFGNLNEIKLSSTNYTYRSILLGKISRLILNIKDNEELKNRLEKFLKYFSIIKIYKKIDNYVFNYEKIMFLLEYYKEKTNGKLFYFNIHNLNHEQKYNILNFYFKNI